MTTPRRFRRTVGLVFTCGFRAAPAPMTATLVLAIATAIATSITPLGFAMFTDAVADPSRRELVGASIVVVGSIGVMFAAGTATVMAGARLSDRVAIYTAIRTANLVNAVPGVEHFERPDYLRELDLLDQDRALIGNGPRLAVELVSVGVTTVITVLLLASIEPLFALLPLFGLAPFYATRVSVRIRQQAEEELAEDRRLANQLFELTTAAASGRELRVYGLGPEIRARHAELAERISRTVRSAALRGFLATAGGWALFGSAFVVAIAAVVIRAANGDASVGDVVLAVTVGQRVGRQVIQMAAGVGQLLTSIKAAHRFLWLEDYAATAAVPVADPRPVPARLHDGIELDEVSFAYPSTEATVLDHVSLVLPAGATVALVGENGAGKSTLVKLLTRMYEPSAGRIRVDGDDLVSYSVVEWRTSVTAAFQDFARYELVARQTIGVGDLDRLDDEAAVNAALERAHASDVVAALDDGLDTRLGRSFVGGREISGGQWQKLALSRALMRDHPLLLIFDEPTASLDAPTEHALFERFSSAAHRAGVHAGAITLLVSHRFSTVRMADLIVVMDAGRVVEFGSHAELMRAGGTYAELYALQARAYA